MDALTDFLNSQKILQIAPAAGDPWIANVYMVAQSPEKLYFIGSKDTHYGTKLRENPALAFASAWCNERDHADRKGIQGVGHAVRTSHNQDIEIAVQLHNRRYPEFADRITVDWINTNERGSGVWVITPSYIKFWNDELYGIDGTEEFWFN